MHLRDVLRAWLGPELLSGYPDNPRYRSLSVQEWHRLALEGSAPPVRIRLQGNSMAPLIRRDRDYVTIVPPEGTPAAGDLVLFSDPGADRYVVHRVWEVKDGKVLTWGDNCPKPDGWLPAPSVWGKVCLIERGGRKITPDPVKGMRWAAFWHRAGAPVRLCGRYGRALARRVKGLKGRFRERR